MKRIEIALLVLAGALAGAVLMRLAQHPPARMAGTPAVTNRAAPVQTASVQPPPAAQPNPQPATIADAQPVPSAPREVGTQQPTAPPAAGHPRTRRAAVKSAPINRAGPVPRVVHASLPPVELPSTALALSAPNSPPAVAETAQPAAVAPTAPPLAPDQPAQTLPARPEAENATPSSAPVPPVPESVQATLNSGMLIPVRLVDSLSSDRNHAGDVFAATLYRELVASGYVIAERGARVEGRVTAADRNAHTLSLELTSVHTSDNQDVPIETERFDKQSEPDRGNAAAKIGAGAVFGAVIGGIAGGGKGAAIGAGAGGGIGAGDVMLSRKAASLASETRITFRLRAPVTVTERTQ